MLFIDKLSFTYKTGEEIFSSFSLSLEKGEKCLILSKPGSGKTTFSRILTGSVPRFFPGNLSGVIKIGENNLLQVPLEYRLNLVSRSSQDSEEMILFSSLEEEITFPLENLGLERSEIQKRVDRELDSFDLTRYKAVSVNELSGGEKKRLGLAILFAIDPEVYVFDESFDELSPYWRGYLRKRIKSMDKTAIVLASHYLGEYEALFDKRITIKNKKDEVLDEYDKPETLVFRNNSANGILECNNIILKREHKSARNEVFTLNVDNFSLKRGELKLLLGDNGSGKSTLSKVICGLLDQKEGTVSIDHKKVKSRERRTRVGFLTQNPFSQLFLAKVIDELESTKAGKTEIEGALDLFDLKKDEYITELSYGKAKLVQSAVFYLLKREYIILDELDSALSYSEAEKVIKSFLEEGAGVLLITHDVNFARSLNSECFFMDRGKLRKYDS